MLDLEVRVQTPFHEPAAGGLLTNRSFHDFRERCDHGAVDGQELARHLAQPGIARHWLNLRGTLFNNRFEPFGIEDRRRIGQ